MPDNSGWRVWSKICDNPDGYFSKQRVYHVSYNGVELTGLKGQPSVTLNPLANGEKFHISLAFATDDLAIE